MIDWTRVNELQSEVGADDFCEVVQLFLEESDEVIERLETGRSYSEYEADFHFLKGSALNLGFSEFAKICAAEEKRAANGDISVKIDVAAETYRLSRSKLLAHIAPS